jgi:hypothetical protein
MILLINSNKNLNRETKILFKFNNKMEELYKQIGEFGRYQKMQISLIGCTSALVALLCKYLVKTDILSSMR